MLSTKISEAPAVWSYLNGLVNVYKPSGMTFYQLRSTIIHNLCRDLNGLEDRSMKKRVEIVKVSDTYDVNLVDNLADHRLATGPRYQMKDIKLITAVNLGKQTSGLMLLGIDRLGIKSVYKIRNAMNVRTFQVSGKLGAATETNFTDSKIIGRADYSHVYEEKFTRLIASLQASHQKKMFDVCGVDIQTQAAYELAVQGLIRPTSNEIPVIYKIKCIEFMRPHFTLEISALNETETYLGQLVNEIGITLRAHAFCTKIRCIRHGVYDVDSSLTRENWNLQQILTNMAHCNKVLLENPDFVQPRLAKINEQ